MKLGATFFAGEKAVGFSVDIKLPQVHLPTSKQICQKLPPPGSEIYILAIFLAPLVLATDAAVIALAANVNSPIATTLAVAGAGLCTIADGATLGSMAYRMNHTN